MSTHIDPERDLSYLPLSRETKFDDFDCGDTDLNDFIRNDAIHYHEKQLARTTCVFFKDKFIGFFSLANDALRLEKPERRKLKFFSHKKNYIEQFPAVKIARMALDSRFQGLKIGPFLIKLIKGLAVDLNENGIAVRFITVDAYKIRLGFYEACKFVKNLAQPTDHTFSMRLDLFE